MAKTTKIGEIMKLKTIWVLLAALALFLISTPFWAFNLEAQAVSNVLYQPYPSTPDGALATYGGTSAVEFDNSGLVESKGWRFDSITGEAQSLYLHWGHAVFVDGETYPIIGMNQWIELTGGVFYTLAYQTEIQSIAEFAAITDTDSADWLIVDHPDDAVEMNVFKYSGDINLPVPFGYHAVTKNAEELIYTNGYWVPVDFDSEIWFVYNATPPVPSCPQTPTEASLLFDVPVEALSMIPGSGGQGWSVASQQGQTAKINYGFVTDYWTGSDTAWFEGYTDPSSVVTFPGGTGNIYAYFCSYSTNTPPTPTATSSATSVPPTTTPEPTSTVISTNTPPPLPPTATPCSGYDCIQPTPTAPPPPECPYPEVHGHCPEGREVQFLPLAQNSAGGIAGVTPGPLRQLWSYITVWNPND